MHTMEGGRNETSKYICKKSLFVCILLYFHMQGTFTILCCLWCQLSVLLYKAFAMIIVQSLKCSTGFLSMSLLIGYLKTFLLEMGEGNQRGKSMYVVGGGRLYQAHICVRWEGWSNFCHSSAHVLTE